MCWIAYTLLIQSFFDNNNKECESKNIHLDDNLKETSEKIIDTNLKVQSKF